MRGAAQNGRVSIAGVIAAIGMLLAVVVFLAFDKMGDGYRPAATAGMDQSDTKQSGARGVLLIRIGSQREKAGEIAITDAKLI
jgi:hypothetical protein